MRIVEFDAIKDLMDDGYVVVSTGGGGVPVVETATAATTACRPSSTRTAPLPSWRPTSDADMLVILTAVEKVCINFNKPQQKGDRLQ